MVQARSREDGGGGGGTGENEVVCNVLAGSLDQTQQKASQFVHKNLTPTDSLNSTSSERSGSSSGGSSPDVGFERQNSNDSSKTASTDSAFDRESFNNNIEDCIIDQGAIDFSKFDLRSSNCNGGYSVNPALLTGHQEPAHYPFGQYRSYFGQPDLNSNIKDQGDGNGGTGPIEKPRDLNAGPQESLYTSGEWIRALGKFEVVMVTGGYYGTLNTIQALKIASTKPIRPDAVRHSLTVLATRTELLQVNVARRGIWPWFRRMMYLQVPFRVEDERDGVMETYYNLLHKPYDMARGPLWRARLVHLSSQSDGLHRAVLMFTVHHCITDAFTNMMLCKETLSILNASMTGRSYVPELRPFVPAIGDKLVTTSDLFHATKFAVYKIYSSTLGNYSKSVYFNGAFPQPATTEIRTQVLYDELTEDATRRLLQQCKAAGVTVHSTIMTLAQVAMVSLASEKSDGRESEAKIRVFNCVNMRRYFPEEYKDAAGCHISIEEQETNVRAEDINTRESLWSLIKKVHENLHSSLNKGIPVKNLTGLVPCAIMIPLNYSCTSHRKTNFIDNHIVSTNMGNLRELLPEQCGEGPVKITHLLRNVSDELTGHPYTLVFHTFLDRFSFCLEYYTNKTDLKLAQEFFARLSNHISDIASHGEILTGEVDRSRDFHSDKF